MRSKNTYVAVIGIFGFIWAAIEIAWLFLSNLFASSVFVGVLSVIILLMFLFSWYRVATNKNPVPVQLFNIIDIVYCAIVYFSTTSFFWPSAGSFQLSNASQMIVFWVMTAFALAFCLSLASYLIIMYTNLRYTIFKKYIDKHMAEAKEVVAMKKNTIPMHEIAEKVICVRVDDVYPSTEENIFYAAILSKDPVDLEKANKAHYLIIISKNIVAGVMSFNPSQENTLVIEKDNLHEFQEHFNNSKLISEKSIGKVVFNASKNNVPAKFVLMIGKHIDTINKHECFYNF